MRRILSGSHRVTTGRSAVARSPERRSGSVRSVRRSLSCRARSSATSASTSLRALRGPSRRVSRSPGTRCSETSARSTALATGQWRPIPRLPGSARTPESSRGRFGVRHVVQKRGAPDLLPLRIREADGPVLSRILRAVGYSLALRRVVSIVSSPIFPPPFRLSCVDIGTLSCPLIGLPQWVM